MLFDALLNLSTSYNQPNSSVHLAATFLYQQQGIASLANGTGYLTISNITDNKTDISLDVYLIYFAASFKFNG